MNKTAYITGTGSYLPGEPVTNEALIPIFGKKLKWFSAFVGTEQRYWAVDLHTGNLPEGFSNAYMATKAAQIALDDAGVKNEQIDLIILVTGTPDYLLPSTVTFVQEKLNIQECAVIEIRSGCSGIAQAISIAIQYINNNAYEKILVIGSELISPFGNIKHINSNSSFDYEYWVSFIMFGDGAGALVIEGKDDNNLGSRDGIFACLLNSVGTNIPPGIMLPFGGALSPASEYASSQNAHNLVMHNYKLIYKYGPSLVKRAFDEILLKTGLTVQEIHKIIPPQANAKLTETIVKEHNLPEDKIFLNVQKVGNTSSASIPIAIDEINRSHSVKTGDILVLLPSEASKWLYGAVALKWK